MKIVMERRGCVWDEIPVPVAVFVGYNYDIRKKHSFGVMN
jgi:hypothetical protein